MEIACPYCGEEYGTGGRGSHTCVGYPISDDFEIVPIQGDLSDPVIELAESINRLTKAFIRMMNLFERFQVNQEFISQQLYGVNDIIEKLNTESLFDEECD